jgi:hypothetical protein
MMTATVSETRTLTREAQSADAWLQWRPERPEEPRRLTVAELAECLCPDICDRDHSNE